MSLLHLLTSFRTSLLEAPSLRRLPPPQANRWITGPKAHWLSRSSKSLQPLGVKTAGPHQRITRRKRLLGALDPMCSSRTLRSPWVHNLLGLPHVVLLVQLLLVPIPIWCTPSVTPQARRALL